MNLPLILVRQLTDFNYGMANATGTIMFMLGIIVLIVVRWLFKMDETD